MLKLGVPEKQVYTASCCNFVRGSEMHCSESYSWFTADLEAGPRSPTLSLVFFKCSCTLPLCTTSMQKTTQVGVFWTLHSKS